MDWLEGEVTIKRDTMALVGLGLIVLGYYIDRSNQQAVEGAYLAGQNSVLPPPEATASAQPSQAQARQIAPGVTYEPPPAGYYDPRHGGGFGNW